MPRTPARVLIVEDDPPIRHALESALRSEGYEVRAEADGSRAESIADAFLPDLVILDVRLPVGPDGFTICRRLRGGRDLPVIFLTAAESLDDRLQGFRVGADDYLVKPYETKELLARVEALLRRSGRLASAVLQVGEVLLDPDSHAAAISGTLVDLTRTEYELLAVLAQNPGRVLSKVQLLTRIWGFDSLDTNIVEVHISSLRRKLEAVAPRVIHTVRGTGYVLKA